MDEELDRQHIEFDYELYANAELDQEIEKLKAENARLWPAVDAQLVKCEAAWETTTGSLSQSPGHIPLAPRSEDGTVGDMLEIPAREGDFQLESPENRHQSGPERRGDRSSFTGAIGPVMQSPLTSQSLDPG